VPALPIDAAAKLLGVPSTTLWRRIRGGDLIAQQDADSGEWLVDVSLHEIRLAAESESEPEPTLGELTQLVDTIQRHSDLLHGELQAYEREAQGLRQLRDALRASLASLLGTPASGSAEPASAPPPASAPIMPASPTPPPITRPIASGNISALSAEDVAFPSDVLANSVLEAARGRRPGPGTQSLLDEPAGLPPHSTFVDVGFQMHAIEWGDTAAPPLLLLHALGGDSHTFDFILPSLRPHFRGFALDLRGHGDSTWIDEGNYRLSTHVQDLDRFVQARGLSHLAIIGIGLGADLALAYAGARPDTVGHLVLNEPSPDPTAPGIARVQRQLQETPARFDDLTGAADWWGEHDPSLREIPHSTAGSLVSSHLRTLDNGGVSWKFDPALRDLDPEVARDVDLFAAAQRVSCPVLLIRDTHSDLLSSPSTERLLELCPSAELLEVSGSEPPSLTATAALTTDATLAAVQRFLRRPIRS